MKWLALILMLLAPMAQAQSWGTTTSDDGGFAAGMVRYPGLGAGFTCTARSVQNKRIIDTSWFEVTTAPPWHFIVWFDEVLIPTTTIKRSDLVYFVGQTGYRLPLTYYNELDGGWQVMLPMTDELFTALSGANRLVLAVGAQQSWELPVAGLGAALDEARAFCAATWAITGPAAPPGLAVVPAPAPMPAPQPAPQGPFTLPQQIIADVQGKCAGAIITPKALTAGDLDGDGQPDVAVDYAGVTCPGHALNPYCGAANCSIDVFMSSRGYLNPIQLLGVGATMVPLPGGRMGLGVSGSWSLCGDNGCDKPFVWNGVDLVR